MGNPRKEEIIAQAAKLFSERGIAGTTVRDIAEAVGVMSGTLYHYFGSKEKIAVEIVDRFLDDLIVSYNVCFEEYSSGRIRLEQLIVSSLRTAVKHPYASEICQNENIVEVSSVNALGRESVVSMRQYWLDALADGVRSGELRSDIDQSRVYQILRGALWSSVRAYRQELPSAVDAIANDLIAVCVRGLAVDGERLHSEPRTVPDANWQIRSDIRTLQRSLDDVQRKLDQ